jgi:hypothetical protein
MPKSLADGRVKVSIMSVKPANMAAPTVAELNAGIEASGAILSNGFQLGATASDSVDEKPLSTLGNVKVLTTSNYEGSLTLFRFFTAANVYDPAADQAFQALKTKGNVVYIAKRFTSKLSTAAWAVGDEVSVFAVTTDNAQDAEATGYIKKIVPLQVDDAVIAGTVA